jgi:uncharacterized protein YndB with AHSA1/START domain
LEEIAMKWVKRIAIVLAVLLIVPTVTLLVLDHRANAGVALAAVEINAPPDQVWTWLDDGDKLKQWVSWMVDVKYPDPQKAHGLGAKRVLVMKDENNGGMLMQIAETYTEYAPPSRMTAQVADTDGLFHEEASYRLVDLGGGRTRVEARSRAHYMEWFANLLEPLITPQAEKKMAMDMARLKRLVEAKAEVR